MKRRLVVGITGASGVIYGVRALQLLQKVDDVEAHLVMSHGARLTLRQELDMTVGEVTALADVVYNEKDLGAKLSSGSFDTMGMVIMPCSIKALSGIANSYSDNLVTRAADVTLKEQRRLVLMVRESPLHAGHLRLLTLAASAGAVICPPVPAFYTRPKTLDDVVEHTVGRILDLFGLETGVVQRWSGINERP
jgi:4-hydroxy-3-polyprenylbenzoate decarboxylase